MYKNKTYSVELIDDALNVWNVNLMSVCPDSLLHLDLKKLKEQGLSGNIVMRITFEETFPFTPPFIQVTYPAIKGKAMKISIVRNFISEYVLVYYFHRWTCFGSRCALHGIIDDTRMEFGILHGKCVNADFVDTNYWTRSC